MLDGEAVLDNMHGAAEAVLSTTCVQLQAGSSLSPGDSYTYTSGCPLTTPSGFMRGHYRMQAADGSFFEVEIPAFSLDLPVRSRVLN